LLHQLVTDPDPVEFATELLLPFTFDCVRNAENPLAAAEGLRAGETRSASTHSSEPVTNRES